jgi:uncharacterized protein
MQGLDAYLDIETTGLSWASCEITVVGTYLVGSGTDELIQLVGPNVTRRRLGEAMKGVQDIFTYNGSRFDLPFIKASLGVDLESAYRHRDLMYDCWDCRLHGGLKVVEKQLGIPRRLQGVGGFEAVLLWQRYVNHGDGEALDKLLHYNREDVMNLKVLRQKLGVLQEA